ncbi:MAG: hypothetical protein WBB01_05945 [Phormidesmis sp.]
MTAMKATGIGQGTLNPDDMGHDVGGGKGLLAGVVTPQRRWASDYQAAVGALRVFG